MTHVLLSRRQNMLCVFLRRIRDLLEALSEFKVCAQNLKESDFALMVTVVFAPTITFILSYSYNIRHITL